MKVLFINPNFTESRSRDAMQPLVFACLKALTPTHVETLFIDERIEKIDYDLAVDAVAMSVQTYTAKRAYAIASVFMARGVVVIMGGFHPSLAPQEAARFCDCVVTGDAEGVWREIIEDLAAGKLKARYDGRNDLELGIVPDRSIFAGKRYAPVYPVQFGRGCKFACDFCSIHAMYGSVIRQRPVADVADEIGRLPGRFIFFVDDNLFANYKKTIELLDRLIPLRIRWVCQVSLDAAYNDELLDLMVKSGCVLVFIGFESFDENNLAAMSKKGNLKYRDYDDAIRRFKKKGIMVSGSFVFGYDHDTAAEIESALGFAQRHRLCFTHFNPLFPTPKTALLERLTRENKLRYDDWWLSNRYRYGELVFDPAGMDAMAMERKIFEVRRRFNTWMSIMWRALDFSCNCRNVFNLFVFLAANVISRKEIHKKQGMELG